MKEAVATELRQICVYVQFLSCLRANIQLVCTDRLHDGPPTHTSHFTGNFPTPREILPRGRLLCAQRLGTGRIIHIVHVH